MKDQEHNYNPFAECKAMGSEHGTGWSVVSKYWNIPCTNEGTAKRIAEIIQGAYKSGREDVASELREILNVPAWRTNFV